MGFLFEAFVGCVAGDGSVGSIVVVGVLPFLQFVVEQVDVVDDLAFEESVELFGVDLVGAFDFAVESRCGRFDLDVTDALIEQMPVEDLYEFLAVVGLDLLDLERQFREHMVDESNCGLLVVGRVGAEHSQSGAVVDGCVLVVALLASGLPEWLNELHIDLQRMAWALLLVTLPPGLLAFVALRRRQPAQAEFVQDPPDSGRADGEVVVALQVHGDLVRPEMVSLT